MWAVAITDKGLKKDNMINSILASLFASAIWAVAVLIFSKKIIKFIKMLMISLLDSGTQYIFESVNSEELKKDMSIELEKAKKLWICTSRGSFLADSPYRKYLNKATLKVRILLPDIKDNMWISIRTKEVNSSGDGYTEEAFKEAIISNINFIKSCKGDISLKAYNTIHIGRIIITDRVAYFSPYLPDTFGEDVIVYKYSVNTIKYKWIKRIFMENWNVGKPIGF